MISEKKKSEITKLHKTVCFQIKSENFKNTNGINWFYINMNKLLIKNYFKYENKKKKYKIHVFPFKN